MKMHDGSNNLKVLQAIQSCPNPDGASSEWIREVSGVSKVNVSKSLCRLAKEMSRIVVWKEGMFLRYFETQEALEAARPLLEQLRVKDLADRKAKNLANDRAKYALMTPERRAKIQANRAAFYERTKANRVPKPLKPKLKAMKPKEPRPAKVKTWSPPIPPKPKVGPAYLPGEPVITAKTVIYRAPILPLSRWDLVKERA